MTAARVLIAGVGNVFLGDDGFGSEVIRRLARRPWPAHVQVVDFGIRALHLAFALADGYAAVILVDVAQRGAPPGTLCVLEPEAPARDSTPTPTSTSTPTPTDTAGHAMHPARALEFARSLGGRVPRVRLVACEPGALAGDDEALVVGLSAPVAAAVDPAVDLVAALAAAFVAEIQAEGPGDA